MLASAGGSVEDGWFTRYGDPTLNTGGYNYFGSMSVEYSKDDMNTGQNIYFDEARDTVWCGLQTRYIGDNNGSPSGQATSGLIAFNGTDGSYDNYAATQTWGNTPAYNGGYSLMEISSNKLGIIFDKGIQFSSFNTANRGWDSLTYVDNTAKAIQYAAPVKVGNDFVSVGAKNNSAAGHIGYYNSSNLIPTGSRKYTNDTNNGNGQWASSNAGVAGTSITNWFGGIEDRSSNATVVDRFIIAKYSYNTLQSAKKISGGDSSYFTGNAYPRCMLVDSTHIYWFFTEFSNRYLWVFKLDHSLNMVKSVRFQQAGSNQYHYITHAAFGADGNIHMFQTGNWTRSDEPFTRIIINKDLTTISDYIRIWHKPQGSYNSYGGAGIHGVVLDSRDNAYFAGQGEFRDPYYYFGGQGTIGKYYTCFKLPYGFSSTGTYDTTGTSNATYWGDNEIVIDKPSIPTVSTQTDPTLVSYTGISFTNQNTNNNHNYSYSFTRDSTGLAARSSSSRTFPIT